eukprot:m.162499 g.162499  ORF g.162499 m.162499 type:complete len:83 (-) comp16534_c0_seq1:1374-1622(-)
MDIDHEISLLVAGMKRLCEPNDEGVLVTKFGAIFKDEIMEQQLESLVGTLIAAKKRKIIDFKGQMLLQGAHDNVDVFLLKAD